MTDQIPTFPEWVEALGRRVEARDPAATIDMLIYAVSTAPGIPESTQIALRRALMTYQSGEEETLDDALRLRWNRSRRRLSGKWGMIYLDVVKEREAMKQKKEKGGLTEAFDRVGKRYDLGHTKVGEIYYAVKDSIEAAKKA